MNFVTQTVRALVVIANLLAATQVPAAETTTTEGIAYFERHIRPLFAKHCYSCHSVERKEREGGLVLDRREGLKSGGDSGAVIIPGDVDGSLLIEAVRYTNSDLEMPPDSPLPPRSIKRLEQWIRLGAPWPVENSSQVKDKWVDPSDPITGRSHWAFQPIVSQRPMAVEATDWSKSPIDAFVLSRLKAAQLKPAPIADRRVLLRRTSIQLIGLPPSPEDIAEFLTDNRPGAFERQVDRMLASPHFGERWGRHWLDLARYADSNGLDENFLFREAWRYRNRVIEVVNADMPFDRFLEDSNDLASASKTA